MRESRLSGSVEGVMSDHDSYSDSTLRDEAGKTIQFFRGDSRDFPAQKGGNRLFCRPLEERLHQVTKSGTARNVARYGRNVHIAQPLFFVADVTFFLEHAQLRAHRRIAWFVGQLGEHLANGSALEFVKNVHDLAFASRKGMRFRFVHWCVC